MPAPTDINSSDEYLYNNFFTPIAKNLCFIHPNYVTISNMFLIIPLVYSIINKSSFPIFIILVCIRAALDCLDGSIARACSTTSKLGAILDTVGDSLALISVALAVIYLMYLKNDVNMLMNMSIFLSIIFGTVIYANNKVHNDIEFVGLEALIHNNYILSNIVVGTLIWLYIRRYL